MNGGRRIGCSRGKGNVRFDLTILGGDALRKRNLVEATETGFLSGSFECYAMFEAESSNLRL